jgi:hypothetical protein
MAMVQACGPVDGPFGEGQITHVVEGDDNRGAWFKVKQRDPNRFVYFKWNRRQTFLRVDQSQRPYPYAFAQGFWLPRNARVGVNYPVRTPMGHFRPDSCQLLAITDLSYTRMLTRHYVDYLGGDVGWQDLVQVRYRHPTQGCPYMDELFDYSSTFGHIRWQQTCGPRVTHVCWLHTLAPPSDFTHPNRGLMCIQ